VDGLRVELRRKAMVSLRLHVEADGSVWMGLPHHTARKEAVALIRRHRAWIDRRLATTSGPAAAPRLWGELIEGELSGAELECLYERELHQAASGLLDRWEPRVGRRASRVTLRWMKTRWGSCNSKTGRVCLNLALAALPPRYLEQVVVHELIHLIESNHGPRFVAWMDRMLPDWRETRTLMRRMKPAPRPT
ncbi:MAG: M48 family metallopeptidase, partial [Bifidobacteriaceae bacterium]|jgi:predicted metal-dependent hydrolase|nr:M48 family metallopeptidase [Bifidobacteriaceae bacterium]